MVTKWLWAEKFVVQWLGAGNRKIAFGTYWHFINQDMTKGIGINSKGQTLALHAWNSTVTLHGFFIVCYSWFLQFVRVPDQHTIDFGCQLEQIMN
jgi:hypothetical protein